MRKRERPPFPREHVEQFRRALAAELFFDREGQLVIGRTLAAPLYVVFDGPAPRGGRASS